MVNIMNRKDCDKKSDIELVELSLGDPDSWWWNDPMGTYHTEGCTFSYADGHVEKYKWRDPRSPEFFNDRKNNQESQPGNEDIRFMLSNSPRVD